MSNYLAATFCTEALRYFDISWSVTIIGIRADDNELSFLCWSSFGVGRGKNIEQVHHQRSQDKLSLFIFKPFFRPHSYSNAKVGVTQMNRNKWGDHYLNTLRFSTRIRLLVSVRRFVTRGNL